MRIVVKRWQISFKGAPAGWSYYTNTKGWSFNPDHAKVWKREAYANKVASRFVGAVVAGRIDFARAI